MKVCDFSSKYWWRKYQNSVICTMWKGEYVIFVSFNQYSHLQSRIQCEIYIVNIFLSEGLCKICRCGFEFFFSFSWKYTSYQTSLNHLPCHHITLLSTYHVSIFVHAQPVGVLSSIGGQIVHANKVQICLPYPFPKRDATFMWYMCIV